MAIKLSSRQQAQLVFLQSLPQKMSRIQNTIEQMAGMQADVVVVRGMIRTLDEIKAGAAQMSLNGLADTAGHMGTLARRGGGLQIKIRGLRELLGSLKINLDSAMKAATKPEAPAEGHPPDAPGGTEGGT